MKTYIKKWLGIDKLEQLYADLHKLVGERTTVHCDFHTKKPSQVIVVGRYHNRDYVRVFNVPADTLDKLIEELHYQAHNARVGRIDMPDAIPFETVYERDRF